VSCGIVCVVGTRPEAIKMAPVILRIGLSSSGFSVRVLATGQHSDLLDRALADFGLSADQNLRLMRAGQGLADLTAKTLSSLCSALERERPDYVLVQGDTTSVLCAALACTYMHVPFGHVEAGLRTGLSFSPFPEEKNRVLTSQLADLHFAPTPAARENLIREGISPSSIHVTGNTVVDALLWIARHDRPLPVAPATDRFLLVTAHRRENFGVPMNEICGAIADLVQRHEDLSTVFPMHPNPKVRETVERILGNHPRIHLLQPVGYADFVCLMKACVAILTDSGGVQEEAPSLGKPVVLLRSVTERPEAIATGAIRPVGPNRAAIASAVEDLLHRPQGDQGSRSATNPYGDGRASERIVRILSDRLGIRRPNQEDGFDLEWRPEEVEPAVL